MAKPKKPRKSQKRAAISRKGRPIRNNHADARRLDSAAQMPGPAIAAGSPNSNPKAGTGARESGSNLPPAASLFPPIPAEDVDAVARSSLALADGVQALGRAFVEYQRQSVAGGLSAARALIDARNLQDVIEVQRRFINGSMEQAVRESGTLAQLARQVGNEAWAPLWPRVGIARGKLGKPAA